MALMRSRPSLAARCSRRHAAPRAKAAGFTLIELLIVIVIVSTLAAVALERLLFYQELAEKAAMEYQASALKSAVRMQVAEFMVAGRMREVSTLGGGNPMLLLEDFPRNYVADPPRQPSASLDGCWFYDRQTKEIVYQVKQRQHFAAPGPDATKQVRYRVAVMYAAKDKPQDVVRAQGARLELVQPYRWF